MKVVIIGSGNVATVLGKKIFEAGHEIVQVVGRTPEKAEALASHLKSTSTSNIKGISYLADIYIIAVSDSAVAHIASQLKLNDKIVVHTAASVSMQVLSFCSKNYGVLYPLQSLKKEITNLPPIPILVDGSNAETKEILLSFANQWADSVIVANDEERLKLHIAAMFVNNFTNHLFAVANDFCSQETLNFKLLQPLIAETIERIKLFSPSAIQTGPAVRKDFVTIEKHLRLLDSFPHYKELYKVLSNSIIEFYSRNNG